MPWKTGTTEEDVKKFKTIETYVQTLDKKIYDGLVTPAEAFDELQDKIDEVWEATHPDPESTKRTTAPKKK